MSRLIDLARNIGGELLGAVYPSKCCFCEMLGPDPICAECAKAITPNFDPFTYVPPEFELKFVANFYHYEGVLRVLIHQFKFDGGTVLARPFAKMLAQKMAEFDLGTWDAYVPIPIHWRRRTERGYNQVELMSCELEPSMVRPELLRRKRHTKSQFELTPEQRMKNLEGAFAANPAVKGLRVLLLDDIYTSGASARNAAAALRLAGAKDVAIVTLSGPGKVTTAGEDG